jgi:hypothetical protein
MNWGDLDWTTLDRLRNAFLTGAAADGPYWRSSADLANYDFTYAERIGWKWDAVLRELAARGWRPPESARTVVDWGCGSGVAGRRVLAHFGAASFDSLQVWDHSPLAREFSVNRARDHFAGLRVSEWIESAEPVGLLVISHVINELAPEALQTLLALVARAEVVLWVEPGTHAASRMLVAQREMLRSVFEVIAPCPHQVGCGLLAAGNERHWCHFFAPPPVGIQNDSDWVRFGQRAGIDLRSLPYSYLVLERKPARLAPPADSARILGRAEHFKGFARVLSCEAGSLEELELQKRANPELFKELKKDTSHPLYRWTRDDRGRITAAEPV